MELLGVYYTISDIGGLGADGFTVTKSAENSALFLICRNDGIIVAWIFPVLGNKSSVSRRYSAL
jgi:hypothetical protein